jgi:hypothetical protein
MKRLARHYNRKQSETDFAAWVRTYFHGLRKWEIDDVIHGAERIIETQRRFPLVAEWHELIRLAKRDLAPCPVNARQMTVSELAEHARAQALGYEDEPCNCVDCVRAHVDHLALRFVPCDDEVAFNPHTNRLMAVGYWLHGEGLGRWYAQHRSVYAQVRALGLKPERVFVRDETPEYEGA